MPAGLPWRQTADKPTTGETREATLTLKERDTGETTPKGEVWIKATREMAAFGPGDEVRLYVQIGWGGERPLRVRCRFDQGESTTSSANTAQARSSPASMLS